MKYSTGAKSTVRPLKTLGWAIALLLASVCAHATPIFLGTTDGSPGNAETAFNRLTTQISHYNTGNNPDLPTAVFAGHFNQQSVGGDMKTFSLDVTGWQYLVFKAGPSFYHYYVGADTGKVKFSAARGLSNYKFFNAALPPPPAVPDGAATAGLLGIALIGLHAARRRFSR